MAIGDKEVDELPQIENLNSSAVVYVVYGGADYYCTVTQILDLVPDPINLVFESGDVQGTVANSRVTLSIQDSVIVSSMISGSISVAKGGTGATTAAEARTNLGLGSLATLSTVSLTSQVTGTLPVVNGGTGATTTTEARSNLGLGSLATLNTVSLTSQVTGTLPVVNGGTGLSSMVGESVLCSSVGGSIIFAPISYRPSIEAIFVSRATEFDPGFLTYSAICTTESDSDVPLIVKSETEHSLDYVQVKNYLGTTFFNVTGAGVTQLKKAEIQPLLGSDVVLNVSSVSGSQTADMQRWTNTSQEKVYVKITKDGGLQFTDHNGGDQGYIGPNPSNVTQWNNSLILSSIQSGSGSTGAMVACNYPGSGTNSFAGILTPGANATQDTAFKFLVNAQTGRAKFGESSLQSSGRLLVNSLATTEPVLIVQGAASQTANLLQLQDSTASVLMSFTRGGRLGIGTNSPLRRFHLNHTNSDGLADYESFLSTNQHGNGPAEFAFQSNFNGTSLDSTRMAAIGSASSVAGRYFFIWQGSTGGFDALRSDSSGRFAFGKYNPSNTSTHTAKVNIQLEDASWKGLIVQGASAQSGNLQDWQNSSGTILAYVSSGGTIFGANLVIPNNLDGYFGTARNQLMIRDSDDRWLINTNSTNWLEFKQSNVNVVNGQFRVGFGSVANNLVSPAGIGIEAANVAKITNGGSGYGGLVCGSPTTSTVTLVAQAISSQTANIFEARNSSSSLLSGIAASGEVLIRSGQGLRLYRTDNTISRLITCDSSNRLSVDGDVIASGGLQLGNTTLLGAGWSIVSSTGSAVSLRAFVNNSGQSAPSVIVDTGITATVSPLLSIRNNGTERAYFASNGELVINTSQAGTVPLAVRAAASQTSNLFEIRNSSGSALLFASSAGILNIPTSGDTIGIINQNSGHGLIIAGVGGGVTAQLRIVGNSSMFTDSVIASYFQIKNSSNNNVIFNGGTYGADAPFTRLAFLSSLTMFSDASNPANIPVPVALGNFFLNSSTKIGVIVKGASTQSSNLTEWQDSSASVLSTISENGYFTTRKTTAPSDAELTAGEVSIWFDSTNGSSKLMIKGKSADGTVVTGSVNLT